MRLPKEIAAFVHAFRGIVQSVRNERHMKIHTAFAAAALVLSVVFRIPAPHFLLVLLAITLVMSAELMNTAIEKTVDLAMPEQHPLARTAKDAAAGAVLVTAVFAVIVGLYVFLHPVREWLAI
ncbi:diacylglycerol kinase family protein [Paenibacillus gansuensis]|uniref:Diacylglycerol kinase family protein n=1 Tax=Paenibacillus gansuensis TaxID=306542 RepID=A0ABW5PCX8_9BACL